MQHHPEKYGLAPVHIPVHPRIEHILGYNGDRRLVAFWWTPAGDELMFSDGQCSADGEWSAWLLWTRHMTVFLHLRRFDFGSSDFGAKHWLLLDRETRKVYAGDASQVDRFLQDDPELKRQREEWKALPEEERHRITAEAHEAVQRALSEFDQRMSDPEVMKKAMRRMLTAQHDYQDLAQWLDGQPLPCPACGKGVPAGTYTNGQCPHCKAHYWQAVVEHGLPGEDGAG